MKKNNIDEFLEKKVEDGKTVSPILPSDVKNYLIDIDGTICDDIPNEEPERMATAKLFPDALKTLNKWYDQGHVICFFTSRTEDHRQVTESWLNENGFKYPHKHGFLDLLQDELLLLQLQIQQFYYISIVFPN